MTNKQALIFLVFLLVMAIAIGQALHVSPTGRVRDGFRVMLRDALAGAKALLAAFFDSIWLMETVKNLLQAVLLSGAGVVGYIVAAPAEAERLATPANIGSFVVFGILMGLVTRRVEQLRDAQARADEARLRVELAAMLAKVPNKD